MLAQSIVLIIALCIYSCGHLAMCVKEAVCSVCNFSMIHVYVLVSGRVSRCRLEDVGLDFSINIESPCYNKPM